MSAIEVARAVATHLPGWKAVEVTYDDKLVENQAKLRREADGAQLSLYSSKHKDEERIEIGTDWPRYADGSGYHPSKYLKIGVSGKRSPNAVAGEIERRLLPEYLPMYAQALSDVRDGDLRAKAADDCRKSLAKLTGGSVRGDTVFTHLRDVHTLRVTAGRTPSVYINLYGIDELTATRILTILKQRQEAAEATNESEPSEDAPEGAASATVGSGEEVR